MAEDSRRQPYRGTRPQTTASTGEGHRRQPYRDTDPEKTATDSSQSATVKSNDVW